MEAPENAGLLSNLRKWLGRADDSQAAPAISSRDAEFAIPDYPRVWLEEETASTGEAPEAVVFDLENTSEVPVVESAGESAEAEPVKHRRAKHTVAVLSGKGGVGKTTTLLGLAGAAASQGKSVLFIDLDPQGSLSTAVLDKPELPTALEAFHGNLNLADLAVPAAWREFSGLVHIVPARRTLASVDLPVEAKHGESRLVSSLGDLSAYDLILIDAPATLGSLTLEAVALASTVVVVAEPTLFSLRSAADAVEFALETRRARKGWSRKVHVALNRVERTEESEFRLREIKRILPNLVLGANINANPAINEANASGLPVHAIDGVRARRAATEFDALLAELTA